MKEKWYLYGVEVTKEEFEMNPEDVDVEKYVLKERNAQRRMAFTKKVGQDNILKKLNGKSIEKDSSGTYELLQFDGFFSKPMMVLRMRCTTTKNNHYIPVHPNCKTIGDGLRFYYGKKKYNFIEEK